MSNKQSFIDMKKVAGILKRRFGNLSVQQTIEIAVEILTALDEEIVEGEQKDEVS